MTSLKQFKANRQNALKSTGPKTAVGKWIASRNATRHGFYCTSVLLPDEDQEEFLRLARRLALAYSPCGVLEEEQVRTIIETRWQMRRANLVDSELFQIYGFYQGENRGVGTAFAQDATQGNAFTKLTRYQNFQLRRILIAEKELARLKGQRTVVEPGKNLDAWEIAPSGQSCLSNAPTQPANELSPLEAFKWLSRTSSGDKGPTPK